MMELSSKLGLKTSYNGFIIYQPQNEPTIEEQKIIHKKLEAFLNRNRIEFLYALRMEKNGPIKGFPWMFQSHPEISSRREFNELFEIIDKADLVTQMLPKKELTLFAKILRALSF